MTSTLLYNVSVWQWTSPNPCVPGQPIAGGFVSNSYVVIRNGRIESVKRMDSRPDLSAYDTVIDGNQQLLLPGLIGTTVVVSRCLTLFNVFITLCLAFTCAIIITITYVDSHIHVKDTGQSAYFLDLRDCCSIEDLQSATTTHLEKCPLFPLVGHRS